MTGRDAPTPSVSVVVTTYRTPEPLLRIGLGSVLAQTVDDLELLVVIDGEVDADADALVEDLARTAARVRVLRPGRIGRARALNLGLDAARAELMAVQDADDASHPRRLEVQVGLLRSMPGVAVLGSAARFTTSLTDDGNAPLPTRAARVAPVDRALLRSNPVVHSSMVARRAALLAVGGYDETRAAQFDYDLLLRLREAGYAIATCDNDSDGNSAHNAYFTTSSQTSSVSSENEHW